MKQKNPKGNRSIKIARALLIVLACIIIVMAMPTPANNSYQTANTGTFTNGSVKSEKPEPEEEGLILSYIDALEDASLITDKSTYSLHEAVNISLLSVPSTAAVNLTIISPSGIVYIALEEESGLYSFTETTGIGKYIISATLSLSLEIETEPKNLTEEFEVIGPIPEPEEIYDDKEVFDQNNVSLSVDKATYALGDTVHICLVAPPEVINNFSIISPAGIIYLVVPSASGEYEFKPDSAGNYVINVSVRIGEDERVLTAEFEVIDLDLEIIALGTPEQGEIEVDAPVNWSQHIYIANHENFSISNFSLSIPLPDDYSNLFSDFYIYNHKITQISTRDNNTSCILVLVDLAAGENVSFNVSYQTSPVRLEVIEESIDISNLIPPEAFDIGLYKQIGTGEEEVSSPSLSLSLSLPIEVRVKHVKVWHNSSTHYHNIPISIEVEEGDRVFEVVNGTEKEISVNIINGTASWIIPALSNKTFRTMQVELNQGDAEIDKPVEWQLNLSGTFIRYKTPAPYKLESEPVLVNGTWKKEIIIGSNASVHYTNVTAFTNLSFEKKALPKKHEEGDITLFLVENNSRIDVTNDPAYVVTFVDENNNSLIDKVQWNVPLLSNKTFEVEQSINVINVQSYPTVGENWTVKFITTGEADLIITAVNGTTWSNQNEANDLKFLEIKSGAEILEYEWINNSVLIRNFSSNVTNFETSKVLTQGRHTLQFKFGSDIKYAKNLASENANLTITTENITFVTAGANASEVTETGSSPNINEGSNLTINATICNAGPDNITAGTDFYVLFYDGPNATALLLERLIMNVTVTTPDTGGDGYWNVSETANATAYWNPALIGTHNISVHIDNATASSDPDLTDNNAAKRINVSAWQKYWGNVSGKMVLADSAGHSMIDWSWSNETDIGYIYVVNKDVPVNWSALHGLGCDKDDNLNTSGNDFREADTALNMKPNDNNATEFINNNITQLFCGGDPNNATNTTYFIVHGTNVTNVPIVNSTDMTTHTDVENANFISGILWDQDSGSGTDYYDGSQDLVFIAKVRPHTLGLYGVTEAHNYEIGIPCALNATIGGNVDFYVELR